MSNCIVFKEKLDTSMIQLLLLIQKHAEQYLNISLQIEKGDMDILFHIKFI